jgi:hypothetical protein
MFILIQEDRHTDVEVTLFKDFHSAYTRAKEILETCRDVTGHPLTERMEKAGWMFYSTYGTEGDCIRIVQRLAQ